MSSLEPKEQAVLNALKTEGREYQNYFFSKIAKVADLKWFRPLKEARYFDAANNPHPQESEEKGLFTIPHWPVLGYLEKVSIECSKPENRSYAEDLIQIIRNVTRPINGEKADNYRTWSAFARIMANLPNDLIGLDDIALIGDWLASKFDSLLLGHELSRQLLPKFLRSSEPADWEKAAKLVEVILPVRWVEKVYGKDREFTEKEAHTALDAYSLKELFEKNATLLGRRAGKQVISGLIGRLEEALALDRDDEFSYVWRPAIEEHEQNIGIDDTRNILVSALRDVLLGFCSEPQAESKEVLRALLVYRLKLVRRIALYTLSVNFSAYRELFWEVLNAEWFDSVFKHELYALLSNNFSGFSPEEQNRIIDIIQSLTRDWIDTVDKTLMDKTIRLDWLQALKGKGNKRVDQLYGEYLNVGSPSDHPEFASYSKGRWGNVVPFSTEVILGKSIPEIVALLKDFKQTGSWDDPTEEGLADVLRNAVKAKPEKFDTELRNFKDCKLAYQYEIIWGFEQAWNEKKVFNWEKVLDFCKEIVDCGEFWRLGDMAPDKNLRATRSSVTSAICGLILDGVRNDEWAFEESLLPKAETIIRKILVNEPAKAEGRDKDPVTEALYTSKGRCLDTLIGYSLRNSRLIDRRKGDRDRFWNHIKPVYDHELEQCRNANFEFSTLAGLYVLQLHYLSKSWLHDHFNLIFSVEYERNWLCAMQGYSYVKLVHNDIYSWLKQQGHFRKVLNTDIKNPEVRKNVIQHIAVAYLEGDEDLTGRSLLAQILEGWKQKDISEILWFFWHNKHLKENEAKRKRILDFWKLCSEKIQSREEENRTVLSDLCLLAYYLTEIGDDEKARLIQAAPYADVQHHSSFFLEYLDRLADQFPAAVAEAYCAMLTKTIPTYQEKSILSIVEKLYSKGLKQQANEIANNYAKSSVYLLKDLYQKYN